MKRHNRALLSLVLVLVLVCLLSVTAFAADGEAEEAVSNMYASFWSLVPPIVAIVLALITKEVYSSLFIGVLIGGFLYGGYRFTDSMNAVVSDGIISAVTDTAGIFVF